MDFNKRILILEMHGTNIKIIGISIFFGRLSRKFRFSVDLTIVTCTSHGELCTLVIISHSTLRTLRNVSDTFV